jgi:hypothetical protein
LWGFGKAPTPQSQLNRIAIEYISNAKSCNKTMTQPQPTVTPKLEEPKFGFNDYAERLNGRAAMIGFVLTLVIEYVTGQGLLSWLGLY